MSHAQVNLGWMGPEPTEIMVTNRTGSAVVKGDVEMLDWIRSDAASTTQSVGVATGGICNIVVPLYHATNQPFTLAAGLFGVVQNGAGDDIKCRLRMRGYCDVVDCNTTDSTDNNVAIARDVGVMYTALEDVVIISAQTTIDGNAQATLLPRKVVFLPLTARTGAGTTDGYFDGINGFGAVLTTADGAP